MIKPRNLFLRGSVVTAVALLALTGCSSGGGAGSAEVKPSEDTTSDASVEILSDEEWAEVVDAANEEGEVTIYGVLNPTFIEKMPALFNEEYPNIKVNYVRLAATDITARLDAELAAGNTGADVVDNLDNPTFDGYESRGALMPLAVPALGEAEFDRELNQRTPFTASFGLTAYAWAWNTNLQPNGIKSWDDFLSIDPTLVGVTDPSINSAVASLYELTETPNMAGKGFLDELFADDNPKIYPGSSPQVAAVSAGEVSASLPVPAVVAQTAKATGAPVDYAFSPEYPVIANEVAIVKSAKNPNAAQVYTNWLLSEAGQKLLAEVGFVAVREGTPQTIDTGDAKPAVIPQISPANYQAFLQRWNTLVNQ